jgi:peroxiredoxin
MPLKRFIAILFILFPGLFLSAQEVTGIQADIRKMSKETDPVKTEEIRNQIIRDYKLDNVKDAETIDMLNGSVAIAFVMKKNYPAFEKYISLIKNRFNQTSMLSLAAGKLIDDNIDAEYACKLASQTLELYLSFKDDPNAKPGNYTKEDWERFMNFAQYPYYDTYAKSLFAVKRYEEALKYQRMAFNRRPEEGIPSSVERYAKLLELNGDAQTAKNLLLKVAGMGKLNKGMISQLESFYVSEKGNNANFDFYIDSLQNGIQAEMIREFNKKMLNETAPGFSLKDLNGNRVRLTDYKGKIVVIDLWATWCVPCIASFPAMQKMVEKHSDVVFLFIAVQEQGNDALERVKKFMNKNKYPFHVLMDERIDKNSAKYKITSTYKPNGIPAKYVIDREGKLRFKTGGFDTDSELINEMDAMISITKNL